jgi:DNA repair ATPase RecN
LRSDLERVSTELENEILQNQDRKKKIRVYVDKLTADKTRLEEQLTERQQLVNSLTKDREGQIQQILELNQKVETIREQVPGLSFSHGLRLSSPSPSSHLKGFVSK